MHLYLRLIFCGVLLVTPIAIDAQQKEGGPASVSITPVSEPEIASTLPDAPEPQNGSDSADKAQQAPPQLPSPPSESSSTSGGPSSSQTSPQTPTAKTKQQQADEQIKEQEQQRVLGVVPNFNITYRSDAASMTAGQKMSLAFRSSVDPFTFAAAFLVAGYHEALNDDTGFGWGIEGFGKRSGAAYLDAFNGTIIGNGILPAVLHQDPRYFRLGHGTKMHRLFYAMATTVICKHDNTGKWEPNYSNVAGNIISGAISNLYYPSSNSGIGETITNGLTVTAEGTIGGVFNEFWPDLSRRFLHKDPTHGLDAQANAADEAAKKTKNQPVDPER
jgi:hypothetical protein